MPCCTPPIQCFWPLGTGVRLRRLLSTPCGPQSWSLSSPGLLGRRSWHRTLICRAPGPGSLLGLCGLLPVLHVPSGPGHSGSQPMREGPRSRLRVSTASLVTEALGGADSLTCQGRHGDVASARPQPHPCAAAAPPSSPGGQGCPRLPAGSGKAPSSLCGHFPPVCPAAPEVGPGQAAIPARSLQPKPRAHMGPKGMFSLRGLSSRRACLPRITTGCRAVVPTAGPCPGKRAPEGPPGAVAGAGRPWHCVPASGPAGTGLPPAARSPLGGAHRALPGGQAGPSEMGRALGLGPRAARCARSSLNPNGCPQAP